MTRQRALKSVIRARVAKTGERYTTARRHVLGAARPAHLTEVPSAAAPPARVREAGTVADLAAPIPPPAPLPTATPKGSVSDAKSREKTGHGLDHWFAVLDAFGAVEQGHTAAARHLYDVHGVPGWHAQGITVAYERARGVRAVNQRPGGAFEFTVSKVVKIDLAGAMAAIAEPRRRARWTMGLDAALTRALADAFGKGARGFVMKSNGEARCRFVCNGETVEFYVSPRPAGAATVLVRYSKLASHEAVEARRRDWRAALTALAQTVAR